MHILEESPRRKRFISWKFYKISSCSMVKLKMKKYVQGMRKMKLRDRIITSLVILLMLPIAMLIIGIVCMMAYQDKLSQARYGVDSGAVESMANPVKILDKLTSGAYEHLYKASEEYPDKLLDKQYLKEVTKDMDAKYAFLAVRQGDEFVYIGDDNEFKMIDSQFPEYGSELGGDKLLYLSGKYPCLLKQLDFTTSDGKEGSVFIIMNINQLVPQIKTLILQAVLQIVIMIVCTAVVLIIWLYKSMLRPLNGLSRAAKRIKEGDLDFTIKDETTDEVGTLCEDFENMRIRLKEYRERQALYDKESKELVSNISHDLKTPLTAIKGYSEGLLDGVADSKEKVDKYIRTIYTKANDMSALVDELSLYAKIDTDNMPYNFAPVNVKNYFDDCVDEIKMDMDIRGIDVGYYNYTDPETVMCADAEQLKRVINNIVSNSVKYIDKAKGIIGIRIEDEGNFIQISIEDNGKGIASEDIDKIFERFYRTDSSRNSKQGGTGLGLAIAKKIINEHGGQIWARSKDGVGTQIFFTLRKYIKKNDSVRNEETDGKKVKRVRKTKNKSQTGGRI